MGFDEFAIIVLNVLSSISLLLIVAAGLAIIFGTMHIINVAHGEFLMLGAYTAVQTVRWGGTFWEGLIAAPIVVGLFGILVERTIIRFLYGRLMEAILATWGLSLIIIQIMQNIYGPLSEGISSPLGSVQIGRFSVSSYNFVLIGSSVLILIFIYVVMTTTRYGVMARAAAELPDISSALGVNSDRVNMITFAFGAAVTGLAGALIAPLTGVVPTMGAGFVAQAFLTVVTGGSLVVTGTVASAFLLGTTNSLVSYFISAVMGQAALLSVAIVAIRVWPNGMSSSWKRRL